MAISLGISPMLENELKKIQEEVINISKNGKTPVSLGPMREEIKKAISDKLMGHSFAAETLQKISKTVSIRNSEGVCGFSLGHASKAGCVGGKSKSDKKMNSVKNNQQKSLETIRGSVWMFKNEKRSRVPKYQIQQKISEGWEVGFKK